MEKKLLELFIKKVAKKLKQNLEFKSTNKKGDKSYVRWKSYKNLITG